MKRIQRCIRKAENLLIAGFCISKYVWVTTDVIISSQIWTGGSEISVFIAFSLKEYHNI